MATAVLVGGPWDGHTEEVTLDADGVPPRLIPRFRDTTIYTEDTGHLPVRIPERAYRRRGPHPSEGGTWVYEPDVDDPLA
ncbi:hypothetical protein [Pseudonocardia abyssalis]|jgi:hypothetical protein|uniref:Uncharacterized protein n=1 Tax=Pseudonocardia abyssalis TaxID=2792008 RepID=A0ABS6UQM8_9PSEU|nr:hypothetical protein [Pseudonocardia abyssalis]MBW0116949.1 hypothetical protein [Pseudonocardia abyssalis]MBW0134560.1 hypothetical protein [Pseudonocardia abyssalis]